MAEGSAEALRVEAPAAAAQAPAASPDVSPVAGAAGGNAALSRLIASDQGAEAPQLGRAAPAPPPPPPATPADREIALALSAAVRDRVAATTDAPRDEAAERPGSEEKPAAEAAGDAPDLGGADGDLIDFELAEHERWAGSFGGMGTAGSDQRAAFVADQLSRGAASGAVSGASAGLLMGAMGAATSQVVGRRLATMAVARGASVTPVPGLGSAIGGVMALAGLAMRDWDQTRKAVGQFGKGTGYEGLANDLEAIAEVIEVVTSLIDVLLGVLGGIAVGMWVAAVASAGTLAPLAGWLSAIAIGGNLATAALGVLVNTVVRPVVAALRALHAFESQGDPSQVERDGQMLQSSAGQIGGAVGGALAGKAGGHAGARLGTHVDHGVSGIRSLNTRGAPAGSVTAKAQPPQLHPEVPTLDGQLPTLKPPIPDEAPDSVPVPRSGEPPAAPPRPAGPPKYADHAETHRGKSRADAVAQYHEQVRLDPSRESAVWRDAAGNYYVLQGDAKHVRRPSSAPEPLELIYHTHPTKAKESSRIKNAQPSQAGGDLSVLQHQHGQGPAGKRQTSEMHFPVYDKDGKHVGYGTTRFTYDPTHPNPLQVTTTVPGEKPTTQRYENFTEFKKRGGIRPKGATPAEMAETIASAEKQLDADRASADEAVDITTDELGTRPPVSTGKIGADLGSHAGGEQDLEAAVNPPYAPPPASRQELAALRARIAEARRIEALEADTEQTLRRQAGEQQAHDAQLGEAAAVTDRLSAGRAVHQAATDATQNTNAQQQSTSGTASQTLATAGQQTAGITPLIVGLRALRGLSGLFDYLPDRLGVTAHGASRDATKLIDSLERVQAVGAAQGQVDARGATHEADAERIEQVATQGAQTDEQLAEGSQQVGELRDHNRERLGETEATRDQAAEERAEAAGQEQEAKSTHDDLLGRMQAWAQEHRATRIQAIADAQNRLRTEAG